MCSIYVYKCKKYTVFKAAKEGYILIHDKIQAFIYAHLLKIWLYYLS